MSQIRLIIREYFNRAHTPIAHKTFVDWLRNERSTEEKDAALREIWDELTITPDQTTESSFVKLQQRISAESESYYRESVIKPLYRKLVRIAAILLIPLLSFGGACLYIKNATPAVRQVELVECFVPNGEIREITLPDSSIVHINSGSVLIYPKTFSGETRDLYLSGEASFTVKHNDMQPFIVKTTDMDIEVLGTVFNVSSYSTNNRVSTTLEEGKVNVQLKNGKAESFILEPSEQITFDRTTGETNMGKVKLDDVTAWKKGCVMVEGMTINDISGMLGRKHDVVIHLLSNKYEGQRITAKFKNNESLAESLSVLQQLVPGMKYKVEGDRIYIY